MEQKIFGNMPNPKATSLAITQKGKQKLSKNQEAFNKLTIRIEKLQKEIAKKHLLFDEALKMYGFHLHPAKILVAVCRRKVISVLWEIYRLKKLAKTDLRHLKSVLQYHLDNYLGELDTEPDEEFKIILEAIEGMSYEKIITDAAAEEKEEIKNVFGELDIDLDGVDINDEEAMAKIFMEARQKVQEREENEQAKFEKMQAKKKKTPKQVAYEKMQEAAEEMKQKNISTIYKQLAKLFHPDLEQDAERKLEKEILMKELTAAYDAKNLHALLTLELRWIHNENNHLESLTEEKLAVYLHILKEQTKELEYQKISIAEQPQYRVLLDEFGYEIRNNSPVNVINFHLKSAKKAAQNLEENAINFASEMGLRHVKEMLKAWKFMQKETEEERYLRMIFGN
ncbi:MAG: hypothetical protein ABL929_08240 [Ferruginibacter sp.]|nr:hypothetical protein [Ferruginibacter sp.]